MNHECFVSTIDMEVPENGQMRLGKLVFEIPDANEFKINLAVASGTSATISCENCEGYLNYMWDGTWKTNLTVSHEGSAQYVFRGKGGYIVIDRIPLAIIGQGNFNIEKLAYMPNLTYIAVDGNYLINGNLAEVKGCENLTQLRIISPFNNIDKVKVSEILPNFPKMGSLRLGGKNITFDLEGMAAYLTSGNRPLYQVENGSVSQASKVLGDISSLSDCVGITMLSLIRDADVTGEIQSLGKLTSLTLLAVYNTNIGGDLNALAQAQVANGRTSGTLQVQANASKVTYNGTVGFNLRYIDFANGTYTIR